MPQIYRAIPSRTRSLITAAKPSLGQRTPTGDVGVATAAVTATSDRSRSEPPPNGHPDARAAEYRPGRSQTVTASNAISVISLDWHTRAVQVLNRSTAGAYVRPLSDGPLVSSGADARRIAGQEGYERIVPVRFGDHLQVVRSGSTDTTLELMELL